MTQEMKIYIKKQSVFSNTFKIMFDYDNGSPQFVIFEIKPDRKLARHNIRSLTDFLIKYLDETAYGTQHLVVSTGLREEEMEVDE